MKYLPILVDFPCRNPSHDFLSLCLRIKQMPLLIPDGSGHLGRIIPHRAADIYPHESQRKVLEDASATIIHIGQLQLRCGVPFLRS